MKEDSISVFLTKISLIVDELKKLKKETLVYSKVKKGEITQSFYGSVNPHNPGFSMSFNTDLISPINDDFHCIGLSYSIINYNKQNCWEFSAEVGFSSYKYGFEDLFSTELTYNNLNELLLGIEKNVDSLIKEYKLNVIEYDLV